MENVAKQTYSYFVLSIRASKCSDELRLIHTSPVPESLQHKKKKEVSQMTKLFILTDYS